MAVVGLTETGKSHFISRVTEGTANSETTRPTCGTYEADLSYAKKRIRLMEMGASVGPTWQHLFVCQSMGCILWFIDSHDTYEDVCAARNMLLQATQDAWSSPLCVVYNIGRPRPKRRPIVSKISIGSANGPGDGGDGGGAGFSRTMYEWENEDDALNHRFKFEEDARQAYPVSWEQLPHVVGVSHLSSLFRRVHLTRLVYATSAVETLLDWVIAAAATP